MNAATSARTVLSAAPRLRFKDWDEDFALAYDPGLARTHLISAGALMILQLTSDGALTLAQLRERIELAVEDEAELNAVVDGLLSAGLLQHPA